MYEGVVQNKCKILLLTWLKHQIKYPIDAATAAKKENTNCYTLQLHCTLTPFSKQICRSIQHVMNQRVKALVSIHQTS